MVISSFIARGCTFSSVSRGGLLYSFVAVWRHCVAPFAAVQLVSRCWRERAERRGAVLLVSWLYHPL